MLEPVVHRCEGCAEAARLKSTLTARAQAQAGTGKGAQAAIERAIAGHYIVLRPFDPAADVIPD